MTKKANNILSSFLELCVHQSPFQQYLDFDSLMSRGGGEILYYYFNSASSNFLCLLLLGFEFEDQQVYPYLHRAEFLQRCTTILYYTLWQ